MPRVEFVNLSLNRLLGPVNPPTELGVNRLKSLVLNNTRLEWESVESLLNFLPALEELHLSLNDYHNVLLDTDDDFLLYDDLNDIEIVDDENENENVCLCNSNDEKENENIPTATTSTSCGMDIPFPLPSYKRTDSTSSNYKKTNPHGGVRMLHFTGNPVTDWSEVCRLGRIFPNLKSLVLAECPIRAVEDIQKPHKNETISSNEEPVTTATTESNQTTPACDIEPPHIHFQ